MWSIPPTVALMALPGVKVFPCPCGSGRQAPTCCLCEDGRWSPPQLRLRPKRPPTGKRVARCYAAALNDCDGALSAEHYLPKCVIELIADKPAMSIRPNPSTTAVGRVIQGVGNMTTKVLCERHNSDLSPLDSLWERFAEAVRSFFSGMPRSTFGSAGNTVLFHGDDIARMMLKAVCALEAGRVLPSEWSPVRGWCPPDAWLDILFNDAQWPDDWGLHVPVTRAGRDENAAGLEYSPRRQEGALVGADMSIASLPLLLMMARPASNTDWDEPHWGQVAAQPSTVLIETPFGRKTILFGWQAGRGTRGTVTHRIRRANLIDVSLDRTSPE